MCSIYKLAPNLKAFFYDQQNGSKLGPIVPNADQKVLPAKRINSTSILNNTHTHHHNQKHPQTNTNNNTTANGNLISLIDDDYYFDYDGYEETVDEAAFVSPLVNVSSTQSFQSVVEYGHVVTRGSKKRSDAYTSMLNTLEIIDLSHNNLNKIPGLIYEMKSLKEIYFNGNLLKKIPNEMYTRPASAADQANFEKLKELQQLKIEEELLAERRRNEDEDVFSDEELEEVKPKKKNKKKKKKPASEEELAPPRIEPLAEETTPKTLLAESLEVMQLNGNKIEHVPENLFSNFKSLREIKLKDNPLREPPQESVCISAVFQRNVANANASENTAEFESISTITLLEKSTTKTSKPATSVAMLAEVNENDAKFFDKNKFNLPNLFFETNETLKPLQSYMDKYKKREGLYIACVIMPWILIFTGVLTEKK